jgi:hypothetical protein
MLGCVMNLHCKEGKAGCLFIQPGHLVYIEHCHRGFLKIEVFAELTSL